MNFKLSKLLINDKYCGTKTVSTIASFFGSSSSSSSSSSSTVSTSTGDLKNSEDEKVSKLLGLFGSKIGYTSLVSLFDFFYYICLEK